MTNQVPFGKVLLVRASGNENDAAALHALGIQTVAQPFLEISAVAGTEGYAAATELLVNLTSLGSGDWVAATSANGLRFWSVLYGEANLAQALRAAQERGVRFAAIGEASAQMYSSFGIHTVLIAKEPDGAVLARQIIESSGAAGSVLVPAGNLAMASLSESLEAAGWTFFSRVVYETKAIDSRPQAADALMSGDFAAVVLRSPSAARALVQHCGVFSTPVICGGKTTALAASQLGLVVAAVADQPGSREIASAVNQALQLSNQGAN